MNSTRAALFGALVAASGLASCSSKYSVDDPSGPDSGADSASSIDADIVDATDAADVADASDSADTEVPGNVLVNSDFEVGCAGWSASNASLQPETSDVHTGSGACRVCATGPNGYYIQQIISQNVAKGQQLTAAAWVKLPKDQTIMRTLSVVLVAGNEQGTIDDSTSTGPQLTKNGYENAQGILHIDKDGVDSVVFRVTTDSSPQTGECFLLDDTSLVISN